MAANEQWTKVDVGGKTAKLRVDYFDTPMKQPKAKKGRVADRTGCRPWPVALMWERGERENRDRKRAQPNLALHVAPAHNLPNPATP